jgi:tetratricopeptide (TPR) repeat protein
MRRLGNSKQRMKHWYQQRMQYRKLLKFQFALGKAYQQTGEKEKALSAFERAYQKKPDNY